ncbi:hypothetical protein ACFWU3_26565 [Streptomyces sp. NPDC058685]|uniref:hypothetical protein n=1 Tax=Streptomyces sp. NPDC058685 TaxID=3346598 RepID=UPI003662F05B
MDLESVTDELYQLLPQDFTAARNERAARARTAGDHELAARIKELRRPTLSAWASNLLVRQQSEKVQPLIGLGEGLRQAHQQLDGGQLRELGRQQHALVGALAREARKLAEAAGQSVGEAAQHEIEATLHAVLADPRAAEQWAAGRLARPLNAPVGFDGAVQTTVPSPGTPPTPTGRAAKPEKRPQPRTQTRSRAEEREQRRQIDRARKAAEAAETAEKKASALEAEQREAEWAGDRADSARVEAEERVSELARELKAAQRQQKDARARARTARDTAKAAEQAAKSARRKASAAREAAERPATRSSS